MRESDSSKPALSLTFTLPHVRSEEVEDLVRPWAERVGLSDKPLQRYLLAACELADAVASLSRTLRVKGQFRVVVEPFSGWVTTHFTFPEAIGLDPRFDVRDEALQEFPGLAVQPDIFWRRLILEWVDKAQWSRQGSTVTVALSQYARQSSSPSELYFLGLKPKPAPGLELRPPQDGITLALIPNVQSVFRLDERGRFLLESSDGNTPVRSIYRTFVRFFGLVHPSVVGEMVEGCTRKGLLVAGEPLVDRAGRSRLGAWLSRLASLQITVKNPDSFFRGLDRALGWLLRGPAVWLGLLFVVSSLVFPGARSLSGDVAGKLLLRTLSAANLPWFFLGMYASILVHELAHGVACRRMGGRVRACGFLFYYGMLCPYVDTTEAWMLPQRLKRAFVSFAGPYSNLITGSFFLWGEAIAQWSGVPVAASVLGSLALVSITMALLNLLPILELDGYYVLIDLIDRPNLRQRAGEYWASLFGRSRTREREVPPAGERALYLLYGGGSALIMVLLVASPVVNAFHSLSKGKVTPMTWLTVLGAALFFVQALAQVGAEWYRYRTHQEIDLKREK